MDTFAFALEMYSDVVNNAVPAVLPPPSPIYLFL
jgi:hypothetical protein